MSHKVVHIRPEQIDTTSPGIVKVTLTAEDLDADYIELVLPEDDNPLVVTRDTPRYFGKEQGMYGEEGL